MFPSFGANDVSDGLRQQPCNQAVISAVCTDSSTWVDGWLKAAMDQNPRTGTARSPPLTLPPSIGRRSASGRPARQHRRHASVSLLSQPPRLRHSLRYGSFSVTARTWIPIRFNPYQALATPRSVRCLIGPDPRIIQDDVWANSSGQPESHRSGVVQTG